MVEAIPNIKHVNIAFVPVSVNYQYVPQSEVLQSDIASEPNGFSLKKARNLMNNRCGKCFVEFSHPILVDSRNLGAL